MNSIDRLNLEADENIRKHIKDFVVADSVKVHETDNARYVIQKTYEEAGVVEITVNRFLFRDMSAEMETAILYRLRYDLAQARNNKLLQGERSKELQAEINSLKVTIAELMAGIAPFEALSDYIWDSTGNVNDDTTLIAYTDSDGAGDCYPLRQDGSGELVTMKEIRLLIEAYRTAKDAQ